MEDKKETKPRLLRANEIDCRVGTISAKGCSLLLYKDARVDMAILDETYGVGKWQRTHEVINDNLFCTIEIWNDEIHQWVKKQDVGTESFTEKEKGEASDSFKRAGFNVGIGRELYTGPFIWIIPNKDMAPYNTKDINQEEASEFYAYKKVGDSKVYTTKTSFKVAEIGYNAEREINKLIIEDNKGNVRFSLIPLEEQKELLEKEQHRLERLHELDGIMVELHKDLDAELTKKNKTRDDLTIEEIEKTIESLSKKLSNKE